MVDLNHVVLIGRLTREAELKYTAGGQAVCKFSVAVNRRKKSGDQWEDEANFFDIVVWGRQGESLHPYLVKGKMVAVDGELRQDRWQQDGQNRSKVEINANFLQLLGGGPPSDRQNFQGAPRDSSYNDASRYAALGATQGAMPGNGASPGDSAPPDASSYGSSPKDDGFADDIPF